MAVRPYSEYLSDANGDHAAASAAMYADLVSVDGQYEAASASLTTVQGQLTAAQARTVLEDGQVAISAVDNQLLTQYRDMGTPEDWTQLQTNHTQMQRRQTLSDVAGVMGWDVDALIEIDELKGGGVTYSIEGEGDERTAFVTSADNQRTALDEYATAHWGALRNALTPSGGEPQPQPAPQWGNQSPSNSGGSTSVLDSFINKQNKTAE